MDEQEYDDLARKLADEGVRESEYDWMNALKESITKSRQRRRPLLRVINSVFWFFQLWIVNRVVARISKRARDWIWDHVVSPVVNDWIEKKRAADKAIAEPRRYASDHCVSCGGDPGMYVIAGGKPLLFQLQCKRCLYRGIREAMIRRDVQ